ncbi:hypothetical protein R5P12_003519 [Klebsiella aerogenes]|nr:hypothetical protein [Klebsiella aerogenes]HEO1675211.1 hypothetical protein [Klebsiella aerogenes]
MTPLLLLLSPAPPVRVPESWAVIWCGLTPLPGVPVSALCRALYNAEDSFFTGPVALSTTLPLPTELLSDALPPRAQSFLQGPDSGTLYFPDIRTFRQCAKQAIRAHNPEKGEPVLEEAWHQYLLQEGEPH